MPLQRRSLFPSPVFRFRRKLWLLLLIAVLQAHYLAGLAFLQESNYDASIRHLCKVRVDHGCRHCLLDR